MGQARFGPIDQIGILVEDLDAAVAQWTRTLGVGPWTVFRNVLLDGTYRGETTQVGIDVALGYQGSVQVELIEATNAAASPYRHADGRRILGPHHVAWIVDDLDAAVAQAEAGGLERVFTAGNPATQVAYLRDPAGEGTLFELIMGPGMREMHAAGVAETAAWDGSDPVRVIDLAAG